MRLLIAGAQWALLRARVLIPWPIVVAGIVTWVVCLLAGGLAVPLMLTVGDSRLVYFSAPLCAMGAALCIRTAPLLESVAPHARARFSAGAWAALMAVLWGIPAVGLLAIYRVPVPVIVSVVGMTMALALALARVAGPMTAGAVVLLVIALGMFSTGTELNPVFGWIYDPRMPWPVPVIALTAGLVIHGAALRRPRTLDTAS